MNLDERTQQSLFSFAQRFGIDRHLIQGYDILTGFTNFDIDPRIREFASNEDSYEGTVVFPVVQGHTLNLYRYGILAHAFRVRGYRPIILYCTGELDLCHRKSSTWNDDSICTVCTHFGETLLEEFGLDAYSLADYYDPERVPNVDSFEDLRSVTYEGVDVSEFALSSLRKHLKRHHIEITGKHREQYVKFLRSALRLVQCSNLFYDGVDPDVVIAHDDKYIYGGIPLRVALNRGLIAYSHGYGWRDQALIVGRVTESESFAHYPETDSVNERLSTPLSSAEADKIESIIDGRRSGENVRYQYSNYNANSVASVGDKTTIAMFTNLIWDASLEAKDSPFPAVFDWISKTIETVAEQTDIHLVIKTHPAEAKFGTNERVDEWIQNNHGPLPEQVTLLAPDADVDTYKLIGGIDVGVVYNSTVGMEMAYEGVPVIVGGDTHYRGLDFTFDPESVAEYVDVLGRPSSLEMTDEMTSRARRYAYYLFVQKHIYFPYYETGQDGVSVLPVSHKDILNDSSLEALVSNIVNGRPTLARKCRTLDSEANR
ncbi:capsular polysaccharide export protein, LipB/KpsS family [Haloarchaeobius sp. DT45]|uniref:capsular polysaccharide export protein, LipB/KpsS family n=1 Tax=Haloarchaeobius sp. DT45 TaxID=3446116 RepID=UPI003F6D911E